MQIKSWMIIPCASLAILACDVEETEVGAQSAVFDDSSASLAPAAIANNKAVAQSYCDYADRVLRAEVRKSLREADGDLARDRERALLDGLRAGEAIFDGAERLLVRGADEVHVRFENGWLVAGAPGADAPLAKLRRADGLKDGLKVHVLADGVRKLVLTESLRRADIAHLIVLTDLDGAVTVDIDGAPSCLVIDGGGDAAAGPLTVKQTLDEISNARAPNPVNATIYGTNGDDFLAGGAGDDTIYGYGGRDDVRGLAGVDYLYGNDGNDVVRSGTGVNGYTELMYAGKGDDILYSDSVSVLCSGDDGLDTCYDCVWRQSCGNVYPPE